MNKLLSDSAIQTALVTVIVVGLTALTNWLKSKFPTQAQLVESNWCYLQPIVSATMAESRAAFLKCGNDNSVISGIIMRSLAEFSNTYNKFEGKWPSSSETEAARREIDAAVYRAGKEIDDSIRDSLTPK